MDIAIVDDDKEICELLGKFLTKHNYQVHLANDGSELSKLLDSNPAIKLIILDRMLPDINGLDICKQLRTQSINIPIIMLTAVGDNIDKVIGLEIGADDYITKPFDPHELLARVRAVGRRYELSTANNEVAVEPVYQGKLLKFSGWVLNTASRQLFSPENIEVALSSRGYELLLVFLEHPQRVLSRDQVLTILSNRSAEPFDRSIDVQVSRLRQKLGDDSKEPKLIKTVRNGGYLFAAAVKRA